MPIPAGPDTSTDGAIIHVNPIQATQSDLRTGSIPYSVTYLAKNTPSDPTGYPVEFAFKTDPDTEPGDADWTTGSWQSWDANIILGPPSPYVAITSTIGPAGAITSLTAGVWWAWIRITISSTSVEVLRVGTVTIY